MGTAGGVCIGSRVDLGIDVVDLSLMRLVASD